jgi:ACS family allantoate permease-like MFS transporter
MEEGNKISDASYKDPEKVIELSPKATIDNGEVKPTRLLHANPDDGDLALKAFLGHEGELITMTPEQEKALLRKIDWHIMPVCAFLENNVTNMLTLKCRCYVLSMDSIT